MKKIIYSMLAVLFIIGLTGCGSKNQYMIKETKEYNKVTKNLIGKWTATQYNSLIGDTYESVTMSFDFDTRVAKLSCKLSETVVADKMLDWKEKWPTVKVDDYKLVMTSHWSINGSGDELTFADKTFTVVITGTGENFESFYAWEKTKMEATKSANKAIGGGLLGKMAQKTMQKGTGMKNLFPPFGDFASVKLGKEGKSATLQGKQLMDKFTISLIKQQ